MMLISHRGNKNGRSPFENDPILIDDCISDNLYVEVDVRCYNGKIYLGHDRPQYLTSIEWLLERSHRLFVHAKDMGAAKTLAKYDLINWFMHDNDMATLTSYGHIWHYPTNTEYHPHFSICVLPELISNPIQFPTSDLVLGICSDYIGLLNE